jgi:hypothetical protein
MTTPPTGGTPSSPVTPSGIDASIAQIRAYLTQVTAERDLARAQADEAAARAATPRTTWLRGFTALPDHSVGILNPPPGRGSALDTYAMAPGTSTSAAQVPPDGSGKTNPLYLARLDLAAFLTGPQGGFALLGSDQGHQHNGLYVTAPNGGLLRDVHIEGGSAGSGAYPPIEAFGAGFNRCADFVAEDIVSLPGYRTQTGTMIGTNNSKRFTAVRFVAHGSTGGTGHAIWQTEDYTDIDGDYTGNKRAVNVERPGGVHRWIRTNFGAPDTKGRHATYNGDQPFTGAEFHDIRFTGTFTVAVFPSYTLAGKVYPNVVKPGMIRFFEHGVDVTSSTKYRVGAFG